MLRYTVREIRGVWTEGVTIVSGDETGREKEKRELLSSERRRREGTTGSAGIKGFVVFGNLGRKGKFGGGT